MVGRYVSRCIAVLGKVKVCYATRNSQNQAQGSDKSDRDLQTLLTTDNN